MFYSAKLDARWGNHAEAIHLFEHAIELFDAIHGEDRWILDAKLELVKYQAREGRYDTVFNRVRQLLDEAERRGCVVQRARLLSFQSQLFMDEEAPVEKLREVYSELVDCVHLIHNPRHTFMAYADLYSFARKWFARREQKFWLARLKGLREVLDRDSYQDLYDVYVLERYRAEVEDDLVDVGWNFDTLDD